MANNFATNDILEVRFEGVILPSGTRWNIVRHYRVISNEDTASTAYNWLNQAAAIIGTNFASGPLTQMSEQVRYDFLRIKRVAPTQSVFAISAVGSGLGDLTGNVDEPDDAVVITWRTDLPSGRFRGRSYIPGIPDANSDEGLISEAYAEELWYVWENMLTTVPVPDYGEVQMWHYSPTNFAQTSNVGSSSAPIIGVEVDRVVRRQTRRDYKVRTIVTTGPTP